MDKQEALSPSNTCNAPVEEHTSRNMQTAESDLDGLNKGYKVGCVVNVGKTGKDWGGVNMIKYFIWNSVTNLKRCLNNHVFQLT